MPRPRTIDGFERIQMLTQHGILAVRSGKKGEIIKVKHVTFGWISVGAWNNLRLFKTAWHGVQPFLVQIVEGGYRLKANIWATEIPLDVLATGAALPFGFIVLAVSLLSYKADLAAAVSQAAYNAQYAADLAALQAALAELLAEIAPYTLTNPPPATDIKLTILYLEAQSVNQTIIDLPVPGNVPYMFYAYLDLLSLVLPFGEVWLLYHGATLVTQWFDSSGLGSQVESFLQNPLGWLESHPFGFVGGTGANSFNGEVTAFIDSGLKTIFNWQSWV